MTPASPPDFRKRVIAAFLAVGFGGYLLPDLVAAGRAADADDAALAVNPPPRVAIKDGVSTLTLSAADVRNAGIETAAVTEAPTEESVTGYGSVLNAAKMTEFDSRYREAETRVQAAAARLAVSSAALARAKLLYRDHQNVSAAQLQDAEGSFAVDRATIAAAQSALDGVASSARQELGNALGAALIAHAPMIADLIARRRYLVRVTLPPGTAAGPALADPPAAAVARLAGGTEVPLALISPATAADPRLQGASYLYDAPATDGLVPGRNLVVSLPRAGGPHGVVVPGSAVVWLQGRAWVFVRTGPHNFIRRGIAPSRSAPGGGYIVADLPPASQIVVRGAQMLLSEEYRAQVPIED